MTKTSTKTKMTTTSGETNSGKTYLVSVSETKVKYLVVRATSIRAAESTAALTWRFGAPLKWQSEDSWQTVSVIKEI